MRMNHISSDKQTNICRYTDYGLSKEKVGQMKCKL